MEPLSTSISTVTVYPDRARITRVGSATLEAGFHQLVIEELPLRMVRESMRTSARGTIKARLLGAQIQRKHYVETPSEAIRQLEEQIEGLEDEIGQLDSQAGLIKQQREALDKIAGHSDKFALALAAGEMKVEQELAIFEALRAQAEKLEAEARGLKGKRKQLEHRLQKLKKDLEQLHSIRPRDRHAALVEIEVLQAGELTVELSYVVTDASWKPIYDLRLVEEASGNQCEISYMAQVMQNTGESWEGVQLALSTARPALSRGLPELKPWYIRPPAQVQRAYMAAPQAAPPAPAAMLRKAVSDATEEMAGMAKFEEAEEVTAEVDKTGAAVTYTIPGTVNIPPDGTAHKVTVARFKLPPRLDYLSVPCVSEAVYRRVRIKNDSPYTLLDGQASLFVNDEFIGTAPLSFTAPQAELEAALGVEDRIKIKRELKRREVDKRLIGGRRHQVFGYELLIENLMPVQINIRLDDQYPVARHEEIKVKLEACEPKPSEQTELNLLKWELSLSPAEKRTLRFDFSVDSPQGTDVVGLP